VCEFAGVVVKNGDDKTKPRRQPPRDGGQRRFVDLLLIGLYVALAAAIIIGVIMFMLWGLAGE
jgi:hypothetical protein